MGYGLALGQTALALVLAPGVVGLIRWLKADRKKVLKKNTDGHG